MILPYVEQANKFNQFNFAFDVHRARDRTRPPGRQDVPIFLCPSGPVRVRSSRRRPDGRPDQLLREHRAVADCPAERATRRAGAFHALSSARLQEQTPTGRADRGHHGRDQQHGHVLRGHAGQAANCRRRSIYTTTCAVRRHRRGAGTSRRAERVRLCRRIGVNAGINYVGLQYYRGGINHHSFYTHTLPLNWNRKQADRGDSRSTPAATPSFRRAHIAASSYHCGGVNVCLADGSVRFVRDTDRLRHCGRPSAPGRAARSARLRLTEPWP